MYVVILVIFKKSFVFMKIILVSLIFRTHYRIAKMLPATGKWKVPLTQTSYESNFKTLKKAKDRQDVRPRNLEIKLEITCCSYLKDTRSGIMVYTSVRKVKGCLSLCLPVHIRLDIW